MTAALQPHELADSVARQSLCAATGSAVQPVTPYYDEDGITIYLGDNRTLLASMPKCDLLLTDPPYGLKWSGTGFKKQPLLNHREAAEWDEKPDRETLKAAMELCKGRVVWGGNYLSDMLPPCEGPLIWDKMTGNNSFADGEMAWSDIVGTMRIFRHQWCGAFKDSERGERSVHPTQKPVALMSWCISKAKDPKIILDPWMGSGTTLVAAKERGLRAIGIEANETYCKLAVARLAQGVLWRQNAGTERTAADK